MIEYIHTMDVEQSLEVLKSNAEYGLTGEEAALRLSRSGQRKLHEIKKRSIILRIIDQFKDIYMLLLAALSIATAMFGYSSITETAIILLLLVIIAIIGIILSSKSSNALIELKEATNPKAMVRRDGELLCIDARDIVIGDIVILNKGSCVPADIRIIESSHMKVDESSITGELEWSTKKTDAISEMNTYPAAKYNLAFMGSVVTYGKGAGVVFATDKDTVVGKGAVITHEQVETETSLLTGLHSAGKSLGMLCVIMCVMLFGTGLIYDIFEIGEERGLPALLILATALAVAAAPKGLAALGTAIMAINAKNIAVTDAAVKDLQTAEVLGKTTVICTHKTGMLTQNKMTITYVADPINVYEVTGVGYKAKGHVIAEIMITRNIALMSEIVVLCNNASYDKRYAQITGDPTEGAMLVFGVKLGHDKPVLEAARPRIKEMPFDSQRKLMSTYNKDGERIIMYTKGAAEEIINRSSYVYLDGEIVFMSDAVRQKLIAQSDSFTAQSLRVLACAYKVYDNETDINDSEYELIYVGMMALVDPPDYEIIDTISRCMNAGIKIKIISGDHRNNVNIIAKAFGIITNNDQTLDNSDIDALSDEQLAQKVKNVHVFSRVTPLNKLRIITALGTDAGTSVAIIGNSLEDVPSLQKADIGIAMGITGTDIAKKTANVIIHDDNFDHIEKAVGQGRTLYVNIRKAVKYVLSGNFGMLLLILFTVIFALPLPMTAAQILFISLLTGTLPVMAIGLEKREQEIMNRVPKNPQEAILNRKVMTSCITRAVMIFLASLATFIYGLYVAVAPEEVSQQVLAMSMCFLTLGACRILAVYPSKTDAPLISGGNVFQNGLLNLSALLSLFVLIAVMYIPGLGNLLSVVPLAIDQIIICTVLVLLTILGIEISKLYAKY